MADMREFIGHYTARFGPMTKDPVALQCWKTFIDPIPNAAIPTLCDAVRNDRHERKPYLTHFQSAWTNMHYSDQLKTSTCTLCDGAGTFSVPAWRDYSDVRPQWRLGYHKTARLVSVPCTCPDGLRVRPPDVKHSEASIRAAQEFIIAERELCFKFINSLPPQDRTKWSFDRWLLQKTRDAEKGEMYEA